MVIDLISAVGKAMGSSNAVGGSDAVGSGGNARNAVGNGETGGDSGTSSDSSAYSSSLGLRGSDGALASGNASPVRVLLEVSVGFSNLTDCFRVVLDGGFGGASLALAPGTGLVLGGDCRINSGSLGITSVYPVD